MSLLPASNSAEWHLHYGCTLECAACTRASFLRKPHTEPMTLDDAEEFCRQARALDWIPGIVITGGEPTMHPQFVDFVGMATAFTRSTGKSPNATERAGGNCVRIFSNAYTPKARGLLDKVQRKWGASIVQDTWKLGGSIMGPAQYRGWGMDTFVSPEDLGKPLRPPCYQHSSQICGVSVDHGGYSPCSVGGALDALLGCGGRTQVLADLFDPEKMGRMTEALCRHCGSCAVQMGVLRQAEVEAQDASRFGTPMSPTWARAFEGRR